MSLQPKLLLDCVRVVLVGTTLARNIGASARAMKVMGLRRLVLVQPRSFPDAEASALAAGAEDVLDAAVVCESLAEAIADCALVLGTSARRRDIVLPELSPAQASVRCLAMARHAQPVALVFGAERTGLLNSEIALCHARVQIPTDADYSSLNLAAAVQLMSYELRLAALGCDLVGAAPLSPLASAPAAERAPLPDAANAHLPAPAVELERLMEHYAVFLKKINFYSTKNPEKLLMRLRRIFQRAGLDQREIQILRGILSESDSAIRKHGRGGQIS